MVPRGSRPPWNPQTHAEPGATPDVRELRPTAPEPMRDRYCGCRKLGPGEQWRSLPEPAAYLGWKVYGGVRTITHSSHMAL